MAPEAPDGGEPAFTLQSYFSPAGPKRLGRVPAMAVQALRLVRAAAPRDLAVCVVLQLLTGLAVAVQLLVLRRVLGELLADETPTFSAVLPELLALGALGLVVALSAVVLGVRQRVLGQRVALHATDGVARTATAVDLLTYEVPGFHDRLQRAQLAASSRPAALVQALVSLLGSSFTIGGLVLALLLIEPLFCLLVVLAFVPSWIATNATGRLVHRFSAEQTERDRRRQYLFFLLTAKPNAQEVRAFGLEDVLADRHRDLQRGLIADLESLLRQRLPAVLAAQGLTALLSFGVLVLLAALVTSDHMGVADAAAAASALVLLTGRLRLLASSAGGLYEHALYLEDYTSFVAATPRLHGARPTTPAPPEPQVIAARDVTFTYPSSDTPSLHGVSMELRRGEVVALVGENGSGKTTLAKALAGLYAPTGGTVTWDGADVATFDPATVRERVAVIFQDFVRYELSARDNIAMGDRARFDDHAAIERAARAAGLHETIAALPGGYDQLLGPAYFGGQDLSGGQWQRLALARAFLRDAPVVILDEPTAALDPRAEAEVFDRMGELFAGRAVLLISHRFGSVRSADRIYVLRDGRVAETGTHESLMAAGGHYAELFSLQAHLYS